MFSKSRYCIIKYFFIIAILFDDQCRCKRVLGDEQLGVKDTGIWTLLQKANDATPKGLCECAVFGSSKAVNKELPILSKSTINVSCSESGQNDCNKLCGAIGRAGKEQGTFLLCAALVHSSGTEASLYTKICNADSWTYTGLKLPTVFCCHNGIPIDCNADILKHDEQHLQAIKKKNIK